jgi:hypothetical protein
VDEKVGKTGYQMAYVPAGKVAGILELIERKSCGEGTNKENAVSAPSP